MRFIVLGDYSSRPAEGQALRSRGNLQEIAMVPIPAGAIAPTDR